MAFGKLYSMVFGESPSDNEKLMERIIEQETLKEFMTNYGLIEGVSGDMPGVWFKVSIKGREIYEDGGWIKYIRKQKEKEKKAEWKDDKRFIITTIISVVAILFSIYQTYITNDLKSERDKLINQIDTLELKLEQKESLLKEFEQKRIEQDSTHL